MEPSSTTSATTTSSASSPSSSHRRELQGPRPAPLRVRKDSHKIRKPPPPQQVREPVIIYTVSPKVVHADASEFMSVVQRLTGGTGTASSSSSSFVVPDQASEAAAALHQIPPPSSSFFPFFGGHQSSAGLHLPPAPAPHFPFQLQQHQQQVISPAARLAAIEQARSSVAVGGLLMPPLFPSILSPGSLPPAVQPGFFSSPPVGAGGGGGINLFGELISTQQAGATTSSHHGNLFVMPSQAAAEASPSTGASAYYYWDHLFNNPNQHQN